MTTYRNSAFPIPASNLEGSYAAEPGMSLLDYFAAAALTGQVGVRFQGECISYETHARWAYEMANAMMKARES